MQFPRYALGFILLTHVTSCFRDNPAGIPIVPVDISLFVYDPEYQALGGVGGFVTIPGGSRGIVVFRSGIDTYAAFDRHCTFQVEDSCGRVSLHQDGLHLVDDGCSGTSCGSMFNIIDGSVTQGPAQFPLYRYNTAFDGAVLRIFN